jgi:hypothetical protein
MRQKIDPWPVFGAAMGLAAMLLFARCASFGADGRIGPDRKRPPAAGLYEGSGYGYRGPIRVRVRVEEGSIMEIDIVDSNEDQFVGGAAIDELLELVLMYNTTDLDAVSGATESSEGFLAAVENAMLNLP